VFYQILPLFADITTLATWASHEKFHGLKLHQQEEVHSLSWHHKGDYFSTVAPDDILKMCSLFCFSFVGRVLIISCCMV
jgi:hypothetical protein